MVKTFAWQKGQTWTFCRENFSTFQSSHSFYLPARQIFDLLFFAGFPPSIFVLPFCNFVPISYALGTGLFAGQFFFYLSVGPIFWPPNRANFLFFLPGLTGSWPFCFRSLSKIDPKWSISIFLKGVKIKNLWYTYFIVFTITFPLFQLPTFLYSHPSRFRSR